MWSKYKALSYTIITLVLIGGMIIGHYKPFPIPQIKTLLYQLKWRFTQEIYHDSRIITSTPWTFRKSLQSVHLPLQIVGIDLSNMSELQPFSGGICNFENQVYIADRVGSIFYINDDLSKTQQLNSSALETNKQAFYKQYATKFPNQLFMKYFRVHDLECISINENRYLLLSHDYFDPEKKKTQMLVSRIQLDDHRKQVIGSWKPIFTGQLNNRQGLYTSSGGRMLHIGEGSIYFSIAEGNQLNVSSSSEIDSLLKTSDFGSIFKLNIITEEYTKISYGHRNPLGLVVLSSGQLLSSENGPKAGDELNHILVDNNYGWPLETLGTQYHKYTWSDEKTHDRHNVYVKPIFSWLPSIAPSNLIEISNFHPQWNTDLLLGTLKNRSVHRIRLEDNRVLFSEPIWIGERIRDVIQLASGEIVLWTDSAKLMFIQVDRNRLRQNQHSSLTGGGMRTLAECFTCHHLGETNPYHPAPSLTGVLNRPIASDNYDYYSTTLKNLEGVWNEQTLMQFISSPETFAPGTAMLVKESYTEEEIKEIIAALKTIN